MKRIWTRGIKNANKFMIGAAIAYNLKKWLNYKEKKVKVVAMEMVQEKIESGMNIFLCFFNQGDQGKIEFPDLLTKIGSVNFYGAGMQCTIRSIRRFIFEKERLCNGHAC